MVERPQDHGAARSPSVRRRASPATVLISSFNTRARAYLANPAELALNTALYLIVTLALTGLWRVAVESAGGDMVGYSAVAIVWYIATTEVAIMSLPPRVIEYESDTVTSGEIEVELLRPVHLFSFWVARWMGHAAPKVLCCAIAGLVWAFWFGGTPENPAALLLAAPALVLAIFNNIVGQVGVGACSFWIRDVRGLWFVYQKLVFLLGGMLLPLEILPASVESVAKALPFMTMAYVPGRLASGHVEPELLLWQLGWTVLLIAGSGALFARGIERIRRQP